MKKWLRPLHQPGIPLGKDGRRVTASAAHIELSKRAAREGMVLLKNEGGALPLAMGTRVALFGKATIDYVKGGGGSGDVTVPYIRNLYEGFSEVIGDEAIFPDTIQFYQEYVAAQYREGWLPGMVAEPELPRALIEKAARFTDTAVISISRFSGEGWDRKADFDPIERHKLVEQQTVDMSNALFENGDFYFSDAELNMLRAISRRFRRAVVVLNVGGMVETACLRENPDVNAVLLALHWVFGNLNHFSDWDNIGFHAIWSSLTDQLFTQIIFGNSVRNNNDTVCFRIWCPSSCNLTVQ